MRQRRIVVALLLALLVAIGANGQREKKPMTNGDVVALIKAGLPEETIVLAIQQQPSNFDTSPEALIQLKNQGATQKILDAILRGGTAKTPAQLIESDDGTTLTNKAAVGTGVIMIDGSKQIEMKYNSHNLRSSGYNPVPFSSTKLRAAFDGSHAELRTLNASPMFEVNVAANAQPSDFVALVSLEVKSDRREIALAKTSGMTGSTSTGFPKDRIIPISLEEIQTEGRAAYYKRYRVKLASNLPAGEYALVVRRSYYDFGVDANR